MPSDHVSRKHFYCVECGGSTTEVNRPHTVDRDGSLVVVRGVPMHQCTDCGELFMTPEIMKQLDVLLGRHLGGSAETIVNFRAA